MLEEIGWVCKGAWGLQWGSPRAQGCLGKSALQEECLGSLLVARRRPPEGHVTELRELCQPW